MFPTFSYLIKYLTGKSIPVEIPTYGFFMLLAFCAAYWAFTQEFKRKEKLHIIFPFTQRKRISGVVELVHPYQLMDKLLFWCGVYGFAGAIILAKLEKFDGHSWSSFKGIFAYNGLAFYGGLIFGALTYLFILRSKGIKFKQAADIGSPGMMLAYGIGRIGCQLSGDGDWGIINLKPKPDYLMMFPDWVWSFNFPHNVVYQGRFIEGCTGRYCNELINPVYPTSLYEAVICISLFLILWLLRPAIKIPGLMFSIYSMMNGVERYCIESIRINPRFVIGHFQFSQAQLISGLIFFIGVGVLFWSVYTWKNEKTIDPLYSKSKTG